MSDGRRRFIVAGGAGAAPAPILRRIRTSLAARRAQLAAAIEAYRADPVMRLASEWLRDAERRGAATMPHAADAIPMATRVVDMPEADAARLAREVPGVQVIQDQPIDLIRPTTDPTAMPAPWHLDRLGGRGSLTGAGVRIAVLDTGIDDTHPDLRGRVATACTFDVANWKHVTEPTSVDTEGHGTQVAGLICGARFGVAPGASLLSGVMLPRGEGNLSDFIFGLAWARSRPGVRIVNVSAGIPQWEGGMQDEIAATMAAGVLPVVAVGNDGALTTRSPGNYKDVLSVGAIDANDGIWAESGGQVFAWHGEQYVVPDAVAPGVDVPTCAPGGGFVSATGTSMAAAVVSGVAALFLERRPDMSVSDLIEAILERCRDLDQASHRQGYGIVRCP